MFTYIKLAMAGALLAAGVLGYFYVTGLQAEVKDLTVANVKFSVAADQMNFAIEGLKDDIETNKIRMNNINTQLEENSTEVSALRTKLSKHDLRKIIQRKPKLFEKIAQKGTDKYYAELEEITEWSEQ